MKIKGFITHKQAEKYEDCQDFFMIDNTKRILAISDGMSQSIFPQWWAEILVEAYRNDWIPDLNALKDLREKWNDRVERFLMEQQLQGKSTWMLENCLIEKRGAGATLCGIRFSKFDWTGHVLGDSCLITVDENNRIQEIYQSQEGGFGNHPDYFDSMTGGKGVVKFITGTLQKEYKLLLVTDALAEFLYNKRKEEKESDYIARILQIGSHEDFCHIIEEWKNGEKLHNDDCTLVTVEYDGEEMFNVGMVDNLKELCDQEQMEEEQEEEKRASLGSIDDNQESEQATEEKGKVQSLSSSLQNRSLKDELHKLIDKICSWANEVCRQSSRKNKKDDSIKQMVTDVTQEIERIIKTITDGETSENK